MALPRSEGSDQCHRGAGTQKERRGRQFAPRNSRLASASTSAQVPAAFCEHRPPRWPMCFPPPTCGRIRAPTWNVRRARVQVLALETCRASPRPHPLHSDAFQVSSWGTSPGPGPPPTGWTRRLRGRLRVNVCVVSSSFAGHFLTTCFHQRNRDSCVLTPAGS